MSIFKIIVPRATTNLITNPSMEDDGDGWTATDAGATFLSDPVFSRFGRVSLAVTTNGAVPNQGVFFRIDPQTQATFYAGSIYVRGVGIARVRLVDGFNGDEVIVGDIKLTNRWERIKLIGQTGGLVTNDLRLYVELDETRATVFYIDGAQIELATEATTYCDGNQSGCLWQNVENDSISTRDERLGIGGADFDIDDLGLYVTMSAGLGHPPLRHNLQSLALLPGADYQNTKILSRVVTLTFWAVDQMAKFRCSPARLSVLQDARATLIDLLRLDRHADGAPIILQYEANDRIIQLRCRYEAGLEWDGDIRNPYFNSFVVRFLAEDPFWYEDTQDSRRFDFADGLLVNRIAARVDGVWNNLDAGANGTVWTITTGPDGRVYAGGEFTTIGGVNANRIAFWDGQNWNAIGVGFGDNAVLSIDVAPDGTIIAGGSFTQLGDANPMQRISSWDGVNWNAMGVGFNSFVAAVAVGPGANIYAGGDFDDLNGGVGNTLNYIARWDGAAWQAMGAGPGLDDVVRALVIANDGTVYAGGDFRAEFGGAPGDLERVASFDGTTWSMLGTAANNGFDDIVRALALGPDGSLYAGGDFTQLGDAATAMPHISRWNGTAWSPLATGLDDDVHAMAFDSDGALIATGAFLNAGNNPTQVMAIWIGGFWSHLDLQWSGPPIIFAVATLGTDIYVGNGNSEGVVVSGITITENLGTAFSYPVVIVQGPGSFRWLENVDTGARLYFNIDLRVGETITIDFTPRNRSIISNWRGNLFSKLYPNSEFASFLIQPVTSQRIAAFIFGGDANTFVDAHWPVRHWSFDGITQ